MICIDLEKCTGCRRCETVCAFFHTGKVANRLARIKVTHIYSTGVDGPVVCVQCKERYCLECPVNALTVGELGQIVYSPTLCIQCGTCEISCPIGAIELFCSIVYVCDLCGGTPRCVESCTERAITYNPDAEPPSLKDIASNHHKSPSKKRYFYIKTREPALQEKWRRQVNNHE